MQNATIQGSANAFFRSLVSLWIVGACMAGQAVLALSLGLLPVVLANMFGVFGMIWVLPGLGAAFLGILGTNSWPLLFVDAVTAGQLTARDLFAFSGPIGTILGLLFTVYKTIIFLPFECPKFLERLPMWIKWLFFRQPVKLYPPTPEHLANAKVKNEYWIFVNGIATTSQIAFNDVDQLYKLFRRPIWLCHNPTDSILVDLLECAADKVGFFNKYWEPKPRRSVAGALKEALKKAEEGKYTRVVLIAHSQGTIISSNALMKILDGSEQTKQRMKKYLEVYAFANCSNQMPGTNLHYLENLSNDSDTVAWLGVLFPFPSFWQDTSGQGIDIGGKRVNEPYWGHLMIPHYLFPFGKGGYSESRLHEYRDGSVPLIGLPQTLSKK